MSQEQIIYDLMKEHADRMDLTDLHPASNEYKLKMNSTYRVFSEAFKLSTEGLFDGVMAECVYDERGISEFVFTTDGMIDDYQKAIMLFKAKPDNFPYPVTLFRQATLGGSPLTKTKCFDENGNLVEIGFWKSIGVEFAISADEEQRLSCRFYYSGGAAYRFIATNAPQILTHIIGEYSMMMMLDGISIIPMPKERDERVHNLADIRELYEHVCWKQGFDPYPSPHLITH